MKWPIVLAAIAAFSSGMGEARPAVPISTDPELLDYLIQDVCVDANDKATPEDPASCVRHRNIHVGELSTYIVTDFNREDGMTYSAMSSVPVRGPDGGIRVMVAKSLQTDFHPTFKFTFSAARDGYDLIDTTNSAFVSFIRTSDGGCFDQVFSRSPDISSIPGRAGGWILFPRSAPGAWPSSSNKSVTTYKIQLTRGLQNCRNSHATGLTFWNSPAEYRFETGKTLRAIRSDHFSLVDLSKPGNGLERFYFTKEYGFTRWEAWVPVVRCQKEHGDGSLLCKSIADNNPLKQRCSLLNTSSSGDPGIDTWGGQKWVRVDCRDETKFMALNSPQLLLTPSMANSDGVSDIAH